MDPARSEKLCMYGTFSHGNREIHRPTVAAPTAAVRIGNLKGASR